MTPPRRWALLRRYRWSLGGGAAGVLAVGALIRSLGWEPIFAHLRQLGGGFVWVLCAYLVANIAYALPLGLILPSRPSVPSLVLSRLAAVSVNAATPFLGLGGEPVRLLWLPPPERRPGIAALVIDRSAFLGASALFLVIGASVAASQLQLPYALEIALPTIALSVLALTAALYLRQRRGGVALPLARLAGLVVRRRARELADGAHLVDDGIRHLHAEHPGRFTLAVATHLAGRFATLLEVLVAARLLGLPIGVNGALIFASVPLIVDLAFSVVPSQIGVHEGTSALLASALGLDPAAGVALVFVQRLRQVVFVSLGFALLAARRGGR